MVCCYTSEMCLRIHKLCISVDCALSNTTGVRGKAVVSTVQVSFKLLHFTVLLSCYATVKCRHTATAYQEDVYNQCACVLSHGRWTHTDVLHTDVIHVIVYYVGSYKRCSFGYHSSNYHSDRAVFDEQTSQTNTWCCEVPRMCYEYCETAYRLHVTV
jgi:hypothetical protein